MKVQLAISGRQFVMVCPSLYTAPPIDLLGLLMSPVVFPINTHPETVGLEFKLYIAPPVPPELEEKVQRITMGLPPWLYIAPLELPSLRSKIQSDTLALEAPL